MPVHLSVSALTEACFGRETVPKVAPDGTTAFNQQIIRLFLDFSLGGLKRGGNG